MENKKLIKKIESYKKMSNYKIKALISMLKILKLINKEFFYLLVSISFGLFVAYLIKVPFLAFLICHFIIWQSIGKKVIDKKEIKKDNIEMDLVITELSKYIKQKKV